MRFTQNDIKYMVTECVKRLVNESESEHTPSIYVGTYGKYNNGSLYGKWVDLDDFDSKEDFYRYCTEELHADEPDCELMFQDYEYIPKCFIGESWIDGRFWDFMKDNTYPYEVKYAIANYFGDADEYFNSIDDIMVYYNCKNMAQVAMEYIDECGFPQNMDSYFDFESFGRDCSYDGPSDESYESIYQEYGVDEDDDRALGEAIVDADGGIENMDKKTVER